MTASHGHTTTKTRRAVGATQTSRRLDRVAPGGSVSARPSLCECPWGSLAHWHVASQTALGRRHRLWGPKAEPRAVCASQSLLRSPHVVPVAVAGAWSPSQSVLQRAHADCGDLASDLGPGPPAGCRVVGCCRARPSRSWSLDVGEASATFCVGRCARCVCQSPAGTVDMRGPQAVARAAARVHAPWTVPAPAVRPFACRLAPVAAVNVWEARQWTLPAFSRRGHTARRCALACRRRRAASLGVHACARALCTWGAPV